MPTCKPPNFRNRGSDWEFSFTVRDGAESFRVFRRGHSTKGRAMKAAKELERQIESGAWHPRDKGTAVEAVPTLAEFVERFHAEGSTGKAPRSIRSDRLATRLFTDFAGGAVPLDRVTSRQVDAFLAKRRDGGKSEATVNRELTTLRRMFNVAVRWGTIEENPTAGIKKLRRPEGPVVYLEPGDQRRLLSACAAISRGERHNSAKDAVQLYPLVMVALRSGLRRGELFNLRWRQVDFDAGRIHVENSETFRTKSRRNRTVGLHPEAAEALLWWRDWFVAEAGRAMERAADGTLHAQLRRKAEHRLWILRQCEPRPDRLVFPSFRRFDANGEPLPMDNVDSSLAAAMREAFGVEKRNAAGEVVTNPDGSAIVETPKRFRLGLHAMRHTFAVTMARAGVPLAVLSRQLGHASLTTTQIYLRFFPDEGADLVNRLPSLGARPPQCGNGVAEIAPVERAEPRALASA